jgi:hypothetical protein
MNAFVTHLNLPQLPPWFLKSSKQIVLDLDLSSPNSYNDGFTNYTQAAETVTINEKTIRYGEFYHQSLAPIHHQWFSKHVSKDIPCPQVIITTKGDLWPHQDFHAEWSLNYVIDAGGDNVETYWLQERGQEIRPGWKPISYWRYHKELDEIHVEKIPVGQWVLISVDIVHGTRNQTSDRISLSVKISAEQAARLTQEYAV